MARLCRRLRRPARAAESRPGARFHDRQLAADRVRRLDHLAGKPLRLHAGVRLGVPLAVAIASSRTLNLMFYPLLIATQSLPKVALAPLILIWLGTGMNSKLAIAWLVAFFPDRGGHRDGLAQHAGRIPRSRRGGPGQPLSDFWKIRFPAALPFVISGSKVAITLAVIGAVIGEFIGSNEGLGNLLLVANSQINIPLAFACLIGLAVIGIGLYGRWPRSNSPSNRGSRSDRT